MKTITKLFAVSICCFCCLFSLQAQESTDASDEKVKLTIEEAVKYALENSKSLKSAAIDLEMKKRADRYSWNTLSEMSCTEAPSFCACLTEEFMNTVQRVPRSTGAMEKSP